MFCQGPLVGNWNLAERMKNPAKEVGLKPWTTLRFIELASCWNTLSGRNKLERHRSAASLIEQPLELQTSSISDHFKLGLNSTPCQHLSKSLEKSCPEKKHPTSRHCFKVEILPPKSNCVLEAWKMRGISEVIPKMSAWLLVKSSLLHQEFRC